MDQSGVITLLSNVRECINDYLEKELEKFGINGLVASHGAILCQLYNNDGKMRMKEITEKIGKTKSTVTELINKLEKAGYVKKEECTEDRRGIFVSITERGEEIRSSFEAISKNVIGKVYETFEEEEREKLIELLIRVKNNF